MKRGRPAAVSLPSPAISQFVHAFRGISHLPQLPQRLRPPARMTEESGKKLLVLEAVPAIGSFWLSAWLSRSWGYASV